MKNISRTIKSGLSPISYLLCAAGIVLQSQAYAADHGSLYGADIKINDGDVVTATDYNQSALTGIYTADTAVIELGQGSKVIATDNASNAKGIVILGQNSSLDADALDVEVNGAAAVGVEVMGKSAIVSLGAGGKIDVSGENAIGLNVSNNSQIFADGITIESSGTAKKGWSVQVTGGGSLVYLGTGSSIINKDSIGGGQAVRVYSNDVAPATFMANQLSVETQANSSTAIFISDNGIVDLGSHSTVKTTGDESAHAVLIENGGQFSANNLNVKTEGTISNALQLSYGGQATIGANSTLVSDQGAAISATNSGTKVNFLGTEQARNTLTAKGTAASARDSATINLEYTDIITTNTSGNAWAIGATTNSVVNANNTTINIAQSFKPEYSIGLRVATGSTVNLSGETNILLADPNGMAIYVDPDVSNSYGPSKVLGDGKMTIDGKIVSKQGGLVDLDMSSGSRFSGTTSFEQAKGGKVDLAFSDSLWNVTGNSVMSQLTLNNSMVKFVDSQGSAQLQIEDLKGTGSTFIMNTNLVGGTGNKLIVTGTSEGNHQVSVINRGDLSTTGNETLTVIETADGQADFSLLNTARGVELGGYVYDLRQHANGLDWELYSSGVVSTAADASANFLNVDYLMSYIETQTLLQRMGDLRQNGEHGDIWVRGFAGKFDSFSGGQLSNFDMTYNGMQIGADKRISESLPLFVGVFMGQTRGSPDYSYGDGTARSDHMGLYASYMAKNGAYLDTTLKFARLKNSFNVKDSQDNSVSGNGRSNGLSASLEAGQKFNLNGQDNGFYIEPQAQFTYNHQGTANISGSNGLDVNLGSYESMIGRASTLLGYELKQGDNQVNVYLKTGIVREFKGDVDYRLNGSAEKHSFKGNWWNNGVGVSAQVAKQHTFYLDLDSSTGSKFDQRQVNAGYRLSF